MPDWKDLIRRRLDGLELDPTRQAEITEELANHLEDRYQELRTAGMTDPDAGRAIIAELQESKSLTEELRKVEPQLTRPSIVLGARRRHMIGDVWQDLHYGVRTLLKKPAFTAVALLTLALGIGANTAIFSVVNAILLRPLQFEASDRLITVTHRYPNLNLVAPVSPPCYFDYRAKDDVFENAAASSGASFNMTEDGSDPERIQGRRATASFFPTLGIGPVLGRSFVDEEDRPGNERVAIVSHGLWQRRFGGDSNVLGQNITLDGVGYNIIGVMPAEYRLFAGDEIWIPMAFSPDEVSPNRRRSEYLSMIARMRPGVSLDQAQAAMDSVANWILEKQPGSFASDGSWGVGVKLLYEEFVSEIRPALYVLLAAVGLVLLIACANVANLVLARGAGRRKEIAIRHALGADRGRVIRQLLTESVLLALIGGALGVVIAFWGVDLLVSLNENNIPRSQEISVDGQVLVFGLVLSVFTGILFGLIPALQGSQSDLTGTLKEGGRTSGGSTRSRLRNIFVVAEVALALVLLIGTGLMVRSFTRVLQVNPGFRVDNVLTMQVSLSPKRYTESQQVKSFYERALTEIESLPGVESAAAVSALPLSGAVSSGFFGIEGLELQPGEQSPHSDRRSSTFDYFRTMGIPLLAGRDFAQKDQPETPNVVIIDETLAMRYWGDRDPIGARVTFNRVNNAQVWREVVGVVGAIKHKALDADYRGTMYFPHSQNSFSNMTLAVRTTKDPMRLASAIQGAIRTVDNDQPVYRILTMEELLNRSVAQRRFAVLLLSIFSVVALLLACVGLYGVMSYRVSQRTHEIGIRMALGAQARDVLGMVVRQGMLLTGIGVVIGLAASIAFTRFISDLLFGVQPTDPMTFAVITALLGAVAMIACYVPARRATRVDSMIALRYE
jgi:putative ABC transport system permease protein